MAREPLLVCSGQVETNEEVGEGGVVRKKQHKVVS